MLHPRTGRIPDFDGAIALLIGVAAALLLLWGINRFEKTERPGLR
jgi:hypothetical protein